MFVMFVCVISDGQAKAARILVQIKSNSQHIRNTVKTYNVAAADQQPGSVHPTSLKVEDVRVGSVIFDSLEPQVFSFICSFHSST